MSQFPARTRLCAIKGDEDRAWAGELRRLRGVDRPRAPFWRSPWVAFVLLVLISILLYVLFG